MPSNKRKNYKRGNYNKVKKNKFKQKKNNTQIDSKKKNLNFIKRSKEAEEALRKQKLIEDKYRNDSKKFEDDYSEDENEDVEENPYDQLISCFKTQDGEKNDVIDSSSDEEDDAEGGEEEDVEEDDIEEEHGVASDDNEDILEEHEYDEEMEPEEYEEMEHEEIESEEESGSEIGEKDSNKSITIKKSGENQEKEEIIIEEELDDEIEKAENSNNLSNDKFSKHFEYDLSPEHLSNLSNKPPNLKKEHVKWPTVGNVFIEIPTKSKNLKNKDEPTITKSKNKKPNLLGDEEIFSEEGEPPILIDYKNFKWNEHFIKTQIGQNISITNINNLKEKNSNLTLTPLQAELFSIINNYQDVFYPNRTLDNGEEIRLIYCLHALNHMLKTRTKILHHNAKLTALSAKNKQKLAIIPDNYRDQGLVRPKIVILLPFRDSAYKVMNLLISLFFGENAEKMKQSGGVINYKRFEEEYTGNTIRFPKRNPKPEDYEKLFNGNTDDTFRIGLSFTKKCIKLYTEFYSSDILISSPLGLRMIIGAEGDIERDYDFLSSIEILILDQCELFFAQNWDHLLHILDHFHLKPKSINNTDFSRVRSWCLNDLSKFYRQTLLFSSHELPEFRSLFNNKCFNYHGKCRIINPIIDGTIKNVIVQIPQIFHKINVTSIESSFDTRFNYFINEILPQYKNSSMSHCMIYIPSYFDYVRLRNYFKLETINYVQICEYTNDSKIARARDMFYHSSSHFLLYSERSHFFRRTRIKGIRHLIMYQPPYWPNFYSEIINLMQDSNQNSNDGLESSMSITILYTKYDLLQISSIIGTERASKIFKSNKTTHMFMSDD